MRIIIAGAGEVGTHLAKLLSSESFEVLLLDEDPVKLKDMEASYDLLTYTGSPTSLNDLNNIKTKEADLFIAVTPSESANMTACMLANSIGAKRTLARVENYEYLLPKNREFFKKLGVDDLIYPEVLAAQEISESLSINWLRQNMSFCSEALILMGIKIRGNASIINIKFNTGFFDKEKYRVVAIKRGNKTIIPIGSDQLLENDVVYFITSKEHMERVRIQSGKDDYEIKNIMIVGGTRIAKKTLNAISDKFNIKLVESDKRICHSIAEKFSNVMVVNCDIHNIETLKEEGIENMDAFIAVTNNSEANILACLAAKRLGIRKTIAEIENKDYIPLAENMDIGTVINKKMIAASYIYRLTINVDVQNIRGLTAADAEILELIAKPGSKITRSRIKDLRLPDQVNIGGYVRNGQGYTVNGETVIMPDDHVVIFCSSSAIRKIEPFFN